MTIGQSRHIEVLLGGAALDRQLPPRDTVSQQPLCYGATRPSCASCSHPFGGAANKLWILQQVQRCLPGPLSRLEAQLYLYTTRIFPRAVIQISRWIGLAVSPLLVIARQLARCAFGESREHLRRRYGPVGNKKRERWRRCRRSALLHVPLVGTLLCRVFILLLERC